MTKRIIFLTLLTQGILMSANLSQLKINNTDVPFIFEENKNLPIV